MNKKFYFRKNLFKVYEKIYSSGEEIGKLKLCKKCKGAPCEKGADVAVLLPFEAQFILKKLKEKGLTSNYQGVRNIEDTVNNCPFFQKQKCSIHFCRPIGCRSYPLTPIFTKDSFEIKLLRGCPFRHCISKDFFKQISATWQKLLPFLSSHWKQKYNKIISRVPLKNLPPHLQRTSF